MVHSTLPTCYLLWLAAEDDRLDSGAGQECTVISHTVTTSNSVATGVLVSAWRRDRGRRGDNCRPLAKK